MMVLSTMTGIVPGMSMTAQAEEISHEHNGITFQAWNDTTALPESAGNYYLESDVTLLGEYNSDYGEYEPKIWSVPSGVTNLCLNGHSINLKSGSSILVQSGRTLNLYDENGENELVKQEESYSGYSAFDIKGGQFNMYGGTIQARGNVFVTDNGTFNMLGGNIEGSYAVTVDSGKFVFDGGQIKGTNQGVYVNNDGNFTMSGGKITGSSSYQSAVGVSGSFTMSGGEICNNCSSGNWGGVFL